MSRVPVSEIKDVARRAGFSFRTVSLVLNHPEKVDRTTRATIEAAMRDLDMVRFAFATLVVVIEGTRPPDDRARKLFSTRLVLREPTGTRPQL